MDNIVDKAKTTVENTVNKKTGEIKQSKKRPKCPNCNKVVNYEQNYIESPYVKPLAQLQTIVLSHNLNVLEYIYNKFICKNLASVGYYIGGMSEAELKNSEKKQVILATYAIANEGLDIPSLNAEFLITPKTDVVQTIGRVLRAKHAFSDPVIYDIVDSHDVFQRQWLKRKAYYKKNNYKIIGTNSLNYVSNAKEWKVQFEPNVCASNNNIKSTEKEKEKEINKTSYKKNSSIRSHSSTDKSITNDSDESELNTDDDELEVSKGVCLLKFKK
jgi:superfamily II DNA or RNA helicase